MTVLRIRQDWQNPTSSLCRKSVRVRKVDPDLLRLLDSMVDTMREAKGVGLAAPQVGRNLSALVIEYADTDEDPDATPQLIKVVNPKIVRAHGEVEGREGCLSVPGFQADVVRAERIEVKCLGLDGKPKRIKASGFLARILQHEIDHLAGVLMLYRARRLYRIHRDASGQDVASPIGHGHPAPSGMPA